MRALVLVLLAALCGCAAMGRLSTVDVAPWPRWEAQDPASTARIDHAAWDGFLAKHVTPGLDGINRVDYGAVGDADKAALKDYLERLGRVRVSTLARAEQFAFWVNLHNALVVQAVLEHYPVASPRDINLSRGVTEWGPFQAKLASIEGEPVSLDDIAHRILRPIWRDARVHYALCLGAAGSPHLLPRAFTAANTLELLAEGGRDFVNHPRGLTMRAGRAEVSSLYLWHEPDFGGGERGVIAHLRRFAKPELGVALSKAEGTGDRGFDWTLNDAAFAPKPPEKQDEG